MVLRITAARGVALMETQLITLQPNRKPIHMCINEFHIHCTHCVKLVQIRGHWYCPFSPQLKINLQNAGERLVFPDYQITFWN